MMMLNKTLISLSLCGFIAAPFATAADLLEAWLSAQQHDATFAAARHAHRAGQEKHWQGLAPLLPQVHASASQTHIETRAVHNHQPTIETERRSKTLGGSQVIFDGQKFAQYSAAKQAALIAEDQWKIAEQTLILRVAQAYFDVLLAQDTLHFTLAAKAAFARQLDMAKLSFEVGTMTIVDTYEAQANLDSAIAQEIAARNQLDIKQTAFEQLTALDPHQLRPLNPKYQLLAPNPDDETHWLNTAQHHNLEIAVREKSYLVAKQTLNAARAAHLPTVYLKGSASTDRTRLRHQSLAPDTENRTKTLGVEINIPIFAGGAIQSHVREKAALAEQHREELEATRRKITQDTRSAYLNVKNGMAQIIAREQIVKTLTSQLDATRLGREVGVRTSLDLLNAERSYHEAQKNLAQARYDYLKAKLQLAAAAGQLNIDTLTDINQYLLPDNS